MTLLYKVKGQLDPEKSVRVDFDPPLAGYEEVKPRLLAMTADAQESLGMVRAEPYTHTSYQSHWTASCRAKLHKSTTFILHALH